MKGDLADGYSLKKWLISVFGDSAAIKVFRVIRVFSLYTISSYLVSSLATILIIGGFETSALWFASPYAVILTSPLNLGAGLVCAFREDDVLRRLILVTTGIGTLSISGIVGYFLPLGMIA
jgi:hypothetical protein